MLTEEITQKLRERYPDLPPMIFHRSMERAKSDGDLFDILDSFPKIYPVVWSDTAYRWLSTKDVYQTGSFFTETGEMQ